MDHRKLRIPLLFFAIICYLLYHIMHGNRSIFVYIDKKQKLKERIVVMETLKEKNAKLENKIARLRDDNLDTDLLDEEARKILGRSEPNEIFIIN